MTLKVTTAALGAISWLAVAPLASASEPTPPIARRFDNMRYFILDSSKQAEGTRDIAYINLIGDFDSNRFAVYYGGKATGLVGSRRPKHLRVFLLHEGNVVGVAEVADLSKVRGSVLLHRHVLAECKVTLREVDAVDARIEP